MLTHFLSVYLPSTVSFYATNSPMCGFDIPNKIPWHEDDFIISYFYKIVINYSVVGLGTGYGRPKIRQRGGNWWPLTNF